MSVVQDAARRTASVREETALRDVVTRLTRRFPEHAAQAVEDAVYSRYQSFADSRIRDFIPVLVERAVRDQLARA